MNKKKKKVKSDNIDIKRLILVSVMSFCIIIAMITYWIFAYQNKYYSKDDNKKIVSHRISDYVEVEGNVVHLKNISSEINDRFLEKQNEILNNNEIIDVDISKNLNNKILSIKISYVVYGDLANYEEIITLNVDLEKDEEIDNEKMLDIASSSYREIAIDIFNEYIRLPDDTEKEVVDAITGETLSAEEFNDSSEKYIVRIREKIPEIISIYMNDDIEYYVVRLSEIHKLCYRTNMDVAMAYIEREIGEINKEEL